MLMLGLWGTMALVALVCAQMEEFSVGTDHLGLVLRHRSIRYYVLFL
jgi:hypothetical protein